MEQHFDEAFWDARYGSSEPVWSGKPNPLLVETANALRPGSALDVGSGEGADAIWLAQQGWTVHAVDLSSVALARASSRAQTIGLGDSVTWMHQNVAEWTPPAQSFDLVSAHFLHLPNPLRTQVFGGLASAVAPGGTLLVVGHHPSDLNSGIQRPSRADVLFTPESVIDGLNPHDWESVTCEVRPRSAQTSDETSVTVHDSLFRARRTHT